MVNCADCDRSFPCQRALEQHIRDSPAHAPNFDCDDCNRSFDSDEALQQHLRDSPAHRNTSPIDCFFAKYVDFDYNPKGSPSDEMARLHRRYAWSPEDDEARSAWDEFKQTLVLEFQSWYGTDNESLPEWRSLCRVLHVWPIPQSCAECQKVCRNV